VRQVTTQQIGYLARIVLAIGIEGNHRIGTCRQGVPEAAEQAAHERLLGQGEDVEFEAEPLGNLERLVAHVNPWFAEQGADEMEAARFQSASRFVEFGENRLDGDEAMLGDEQHVDAHANTVARTA